MGVGDLNLWAGLDYLRFSEHTVLFGMAEGSRSGLKVWRRLPARRRDHDDLKSKEQWFKR